MLAQLGHLWQRFIKQFGEPSDKEARIVRAEGRQAPLPPPVPRDGLHMLAEFSIPSQPGNERQAMTQVIAVVTSCELALAQRQVDRIKTAVAEATMNAMEHGNHFQPEQHVEFELLTSPTHLVIRITDKGGGNFIPAVPEPDLQAKLDGLQSPRGWGLFLIKNMVDEMCVCQDEFHHTIELLFKL